MEGRWEQMKQKMMYFFFIQLTCTIFKNVINYHLATTSFVTMLENKIINNGVLKCVSV